MSKEKFKQERLKEFDEKFTHTIWMDVPDRAGGHQKFIVKELKSFLSETIDLCFKKMEEVSFTKSELQVMAIDYEGLMTVNDYMKTTISGNAELAENMVNAELVRRELWQKIKKFLPKTKEELILIKPKSLKQKTNEK